MSKGMREDQVLRARQTLAYMLPVLSLAIQRAEAEALALAADGRPHEAGSLQAVVCAPSRELAMQIVRVAHGLLPPDARGCVQQCIGGANPHRQARRPEAGAGPRGAAPRGRAHSGVWRALGRDAQGRAGLFVVGMRKCVSSADSDDSDRRWGHPALRGMPVAAAACDAGHPVPSDLLGGRWPGRWHARPPCTAAR